MIFTFLGIANLSSSYLPKLEELKLEQKMGINTLYKKR